MMDELETGFPSSQLSEDRRASPAQAREEPQLANSISNLIPFALDSVLLCFCEFLFTKHIQSDIVLEYFFLHISTYAVQIPGSERQEVTS